MAIPTQARTCAQAPARAGAQIRTLYQCLSFITILHTITCTIILIIPLPIFIMMMPSHLSSKVQQAVTGRQGR